MDVTNASDDRVARGRDKNDSGEPPAMDADVIIVGAGPTGLMLACELCLAGVRPLELERQLQIREIPKAGGLSGQILELLRYRGDLERFEAAGTALRPALGAGLLDTVNLAWKLAADIHGWAPAGLLDTYNDERQLAGARTMLHTQAQVAIRRGHDAAAQALRELFQELLVDEQPLRRIGALMAGSDIRYPLPGHEHHALIGTFAPDLALRTDRGATSVAELMHTARPILLDLADRRDLREASRGWQHRVDIHTAGTDHRPADALLIRPDAHIAWAATMDEPTDTAALTLREALSRWFGLPQSSG